MSPDFDFWRMLAGIGLFLFAMSHLEQALKAMGGRALSGFLRQNTQRPSQSVVAGIVATAFLQSSSVVGLMVLAFVGAEMLTLKSALGIIFGSNLGTTFTGWIVAVLGFKLDVIDFALPLIAVGSFALISLSIRIANVGRITLGLGLLLLGLQFMKDSVASLQDVVELSTLAGLAPLQYLLFGFVFAAVIQSSSATMMVTLAALDGGIITLPNAAAVAIGADLGTTTTVMIGAVSGAASKKRVALAHFIFNLVTDLIAFIFRLPLLALIAAVGISDALLALVAFHSAFNIVGVAIFMPMIGVLSAFLEKRFVVATPPVARYLTGVDPAISDAAIRAIEQETARLTGQVIAQNMHAFEPAIPLPAGRMPVPVAFRPVVEGSDEFAREYADIKRLEGSILAFATRIQTQPLDKDEAERLSQLLSAVRQSVHSAKTLKDIRHNLDEFQDSYSPQILEYIDHFRSLQTSFYSELFRLRQTEDGVVAFEDIVEVIGKAHVWHEQMHGEIYASVSQNEIKEGEISTLLNVNREVLNSNLALLMALKDFHLDPGQARMVNQLPGAA